MTSTTLGRRNPHHARRPLVYFHVVTRKDSIARQAAQTHFGGSTTQSTAKILASLVPLPASPVFYTPDLGGMHLPRLAFLHHLVLRLARLIRGSGGKLGYHFADWDRSGVFSWFSLMTTWPLPVTGHCRRAAPCSHFALSYTRCNRGCYTCAPTHSGNLRFFLATHHVIA